MGAELEQTAVIHGFYLVPVQRVTAGVGIVRVLDVACYECNGRLHAGLLKNGRCDRIIGEVSVVKGDHHGTGGEAALSLADLLDFAREQRRIAKRLQKLHVQTETLIRDRHAGGFVRVLSQIVVHQNGHRAALRLCRTGGKPCRQREYRSRSGYAPLKKLIHRFFPAFLSGGEENPYSVGAETSIAQISSSVYFRTPRLLHTANEGDIIVQ